MTAIIKTIFFWGVAPCSSADFFHHTRSYYCLHHQGEAQHFSSDSRRYHMSFVHDTQRGVVADPATRPSSNATGTDCTVIRRPVASSRGSSARMLVVYTARAEPLVKHELFEVQWDNICAFRSLQVDRAGCRKSRLFRRSIDRSMCVL